MIGHDERMILVVIRKDDHSIRHIFDLGYAVLESGEFDRLALLADSKGLDLYLTVAGQVQSYVSLYETLGREL